MKIKPHSLLWLFVPVALFSCTLWPNSAIDIQIHDTYFVIAYSHIAVLIGVIFFLYGLVYFVAEKRKWKMVNFLSWFHAIVTFVLSALFIVQNFWIDNVRTPNRYFRFDSTGGEGSAKNILSMLLIIFILAQIAFIANLFLAAFKKRNVA